MCACSTLASTTLLICLEILQHFPLKSKKNKRQGVDTQEPPGGSLSEHLDSIITQPVWSVRVCACVWLLYSVVFLRRFRGEHFAGSLPRFELFRSVVWVLGSGFSPDTPASSHRTKKRTWELIGHSEVSGGVNVQAIGAHLTGRGGPTSGRSAFPGSSCQRLKELLLVLNPERSRRGPAAAAHWRL